MKRIVFTFGTLYPDDIIKELLQTIPDNFYATLSGYSIYKAGFFQLPSVVQESFAARNIDKDTFSYLFAKKDRDNSNTIYGRAYYIDSNQEFILDQWEQFPNWYKKINVEIIDRKGKKHNAYIYTLSIDGERITEFKRIPNELKQVIEHAKITRVKALEKKSTTNL